MYKSLLFITTVFGLVHLTLTAPYIKNLILGHEAEQNQFPWQVSVTNYKGEAEALLCGGILISSAWILTAASCISNNTNNILIGLGSNEIRSPEIIMGAVDIVVHNEYQPKQIRLPIHNIALIKMNGTVNFTDWIEPILLPDEDQIGLTFEGVKAKNSGWGAIVIQTINNTTFHISTSDSLNWHELTVISNSECSLTYSTDIKDHLLCTRVVSGGNVCGCDIGGPLIILDPQGWKLIGVSSYTPGCDSPNPAVFSRITSYLNWISNISGIKVNV